MRITLSLTCNHQTDKENHDHNITVMSLTCNHQTDKENELTNMSCHPHQNNTDKKRE